MPRSMVGLQLQQLCLITACILTLWSLLLPVVSASDRIERRMRHLEATFSALEESVSHMLTNHRSARGDIDHEMQRRNLAPPPHVVDNEYDLLDHDALFKICPVDVHSGHCLAQYGQGVRAWPEPSPSERAALGKDTWDRSMWRFELDRRGEGTARGRIVNPFGWGALYQRQYSDNVDLGSQDGALDVWDFESFRSPQGQILWSVKLVTGENCHQLQTRCGEYLTMGGSVHDVYTTRGFAVWRIEKIVPAAPPVQPHSISNIADGQLYKICPARRHPHHCLHVGHAVWDMSVFPEFSDPNSEFKHWQGSLWRIYKEGNSFVIESILHGSNHLLHVDERASADVTVQHTAPNEGSRWTISEYTEQGPRQDADGVWRTEFVFKPSQRHTDNILHIGGATYDVISSAVPAYAPPHEGSTWFIVAV